MSSHSGTGYDDRAATMLLPPTELLEKEPRRDNLNYRIIQVVPLSHKRPSANYARAALFRQSSDKSMLWLASQFVRTDPPEIGSGIISCVPSSRLDRSMGSPTETSC